ncbi:hypothetical protein PF002_g6329 [Phytophthora fragariae]|uniref:Uncharacterized protein n=1 Tax=Phytophthora fragariae TaxID=53985 RepID=A0A6A3T288_9STRA|nr:hypothetical protein PF003_g37485 [Phytophthora fragariae]KAE9125909.1 hypothetical protein PF007_g6184 [Phytophthora fragariae]KAE9247345.1 hypothetical protein PF002_g6329 [Phytophthora fragariae]KAE9320519.1 hypothetical protein PF001_g5372 [Phytophthora fragariae]
MEHAEMVGIARGYKCSERFKVYKFSQHVRDKAELFFQHHSIRGSTLGYIMEHVSILPASYSPSRPCGYLTR